MILADRWSSIEEIVAAHPALRLDLGCGYVKEAGHVGLDDLRGVDSLSGQFPSVEGGPDVLLDLSAEAYPFPDESVEAIRSRHFLEHAVLDHVFQESHRILRSGGAFVAIVPYANSADGMAPGHQVFLTERWFKLNRRFNERFQTTRITYRPSEEWEAWPRLLRHLIPYDWARVHLFNVCKEMRVEAVRRP
jgi:SAM-dependent methyltransferase